MTRVTLPFSRDELLRRSDALIAKGGPFDCLDVTMRRAFETFETIFYTDEHNELIRQAIAAKKASKSFVWPEGTQVFRGHPHRVELTPDEAENLLTGHCAMSAEYSNGLLNNIRYRLFEEENLLKRSRDERIRILVEEADGPGLVPLGFPVLAEQIGKASETSLQALRGVADEMSLWMTKNNAVIPSEKKSTMDTALAEYRAALPAIEEYIDYARGYFKQIDTRPAAQHANEHH